MILKIPLVEEEIEMKQRHMVKHSTELDTLERQIPCSSQGTDLPDIWALDVE